MSTQHTPGPWFADGVHVAGSDGDIYATSIAVCIDDGFTCSSEKRANARLIASAPELLEALETTVRLLELLNAPGAQDPIEAAVSTAKQVIEKAKGTE